MKKPINLPALYAYLVCVVMLIAFIVCGTQLVRSALNLAIPSQTDSYSNLKYGYGDNVTVTVEPDAQELYDNTLASMQRQVQINGMIAGVAQLLVIIPIYFYHWRLAERYRNQEQIDITLKEIYLFTGSLITLSISVIAFLTAVDTLVGLIFGSQSYLPGIESTIKENLSQQQSNVVITKAQVETLISESKATYYYPRQTLISQFTAIIIALPLYFWHWSIVKKSCRRPVS